MVDCIFKSCIPLSDAARLFPLRNGRYPTVKSLRRRITHGCRGVRLRAVLDGHRWYTTAEWVTEFLEESTRKAMPNAVPHPKARDDASRRAMEHLERRYGPNGWKTGDEAKEVHCVRR